MSNRQKIAVIGAGISGLGAAYLLHPHHDITVFEKAPTVGGHTRTRVVTHQGKKLAVDTGFIVYNEKNYPNLTRFFRHLAVETVDTVMTFGVTAANDVVEWGAESLSALFAQRRNIFRPAFYRFLIDILVFNRRARRSVDRNPRLTVGELIKTLKLSTWFRDYYLLPMGGAIWSCTLDAMLRFPAKFFVDFFEAYGLLTVTQQPQWRTVVGGSQVYVDRLLEKLGATIVTSASITAVVRQRDKIRVDVNGRSEIFDKVIFACHASEVLRVMIDAKQDERDILAVFRQQKNVAYLHNDAFFMPRRKACWSSWIYLANASPKGGPIAVTYWMNRLQHIDQETPIFVTLNPPRPISPDNVFDEHVFYHPVYDPATVAAQGKLNTLQGRDGVWFCGAYTRNGFHEDGLASAVAVAEQMGVAPPW